VGGQLRTITGRAGFVGAGSDAAAQEVSDVREAPAFRGESTEVVEA
jgi:hypothetical protein